MINPALRSWLPVSSESDFPIQNIPFGIFQAKNQAPRVATIIGDTLIDLYTLSKLGYLEGTGVSENTLSQNVLNDFIAQGKKITNQVRWRVAELFDENNLVLKDNLAHQKEIFHKAGEVEMLLPIKIGDYTDFYSSKEHATNVGTMFRDPQNALFPNWLHLPVAYHGRSSTIVASGTPVVRPVGQTTPSEGSTTPNFGPSRLMDFELEMGFVIGKESVMGERVSTENAEEYIFGMMLFNDWSARDIQKWEYIPLGPFLAKNFASSLSCWVVTLEALEPLRVECPHQEPPVLPYLQYEGLKSFDINLEVDIVPENAQATTVSKSNHKYLYWNIAQQLAHHTIGGCKMNVGDLCASGTISGPTPDSYGSMLEITWQGTRPVKMNDGTERKFLQDGDTVVMRGFGVKNGIRIGFGEVSSKVLPAKPF